MNNLYEALEICLRDIEQGADIETVLFRHPDLADELRPILEASENAKSMAVPDPSTDMLRRNRTKLLQHAAGMRESKARSASRRIWSVSLRRVAVTLVVVAILLLFTFNLQQREALEIEHENKRLDELNELFAEGRSEKVDFAGLVTLQNGDQWLVAGFPVVISTQTEMPDQPVAIGNAVRVTGVTGGDGIVLAERVKLLPPGAKLPDVDDKRENEEESNEGPNQQNEDNSGTGSEGESPQGEETKTPEIESENSGSNSGSGSDSNNNDNTSSGTSSNDENSNDGNINDSGSNNDNSHNDNSSEDNSNDGGSSGSGGGGSGGGGED